MLTLFSAEIFVYTFLKFFLLDNQPYNFLIKDFKGFPGSCQVLFASDLLRHNERVLHDLEFSF